MDDLDHKIAKMHRMSVNAAVKRAKPQSLSPTAFCRWLNEMALDGLARSDAECARMLGVSANSVVEMKRRGADLRTALACRALLHRLEPYQ